MLKWRHRDNRWDNWEAGVQNTINGLLLSRSDLRTETNQKYAPPAGIEPGNSCIAATHLRYDEHKLILMGWNYKTLSVLLYVFFCDFENVHLVNIDFCFNFELNSLILKNWTERLLPVSVINFLSHNYRLKYFNESLIILFLSLFLALFHTSKWSSTHEFFIFGFYFIFYATSKCYIVVFMIKRCFQMLYTTL